MKVFFDTSALAKRYTGEPGSELVFELCQEADAIGVSVICLPEIISTLCRLVREEKLPDSQYHALKEQILADLGDADVCDITPSAMLHSIQLLESNTLRAMDALHIGSALAYQADVFASADRRQIDAARKAGLKVVDVQAL